MSLLDAIRSDCSAAVWSRGVQIARAGKVAAASVEPTEDDEVILRVEMREDTPAFEVHLWPSDEDWSCNCPSPQNTCVHVAAAVIAWNQSRMTGRGLSGKAAQRDRLGYRFTRTPRGLHFQRVRVNGTGEKPFVGTLNGRIEGKPVTYREEDVRVEEVMNFRFDRIVPRELMPRLLGALSHVNDVRVDERVVDASPEPVVPHGRIESEGEGFRVRKIGRAHV